MDFENPMARRAVRIAFAQIQGIAVANGKLSWWARMSFVREVADEMTRGVGTEIPAGRGGELAHVAESACSANVLALALRKTAMALVGAVRRQTGCSDF